VKEESLLEQAREQHRADDFPELPRSLLWVRARAPGCWVSIEIQWVSRSIWFQGRSRF